MVDLPRYEKNIESDLSTVILYRPIESVKVITPLFELTFTDGMATIRVVSKTLPEIHTCDFSEVLAKTRRVSRIILFNGNSALDVIDGNLSLKIVQVCPKEMLICLIHHNIGTDRLNYSAPSHSSITLG